MSEAKRVTEVTGKYLTVNDVHKMKIHRVAELPSIRTSQIGESNVSVRRGSTWFENELGKAIEYVADTSTFIDGNEPFRLEKDDFMEQIMSALAVCSMQNIVTDSICHDDGSITGIYLHEGGDNRRHTRRIPPMELLILLESWEGQPEMVWKALEEKGLLRDPKQLVTE